MKVPASWTDGEGLIKDFRPDEIIGRAFDRMAENPIRTALWAVFLAIVVGGSIFSFFEKDASIPDGMWWAFVSMSTVGYGDISPATTGIRMLATGIITCGIVATTIMGAALVSRVMEDRNPQLHQSEYTPELDDDIDAIICRLEDSITHLKLIKPHVGTKGEVDA